MVELTLLSTFLMGLAVVAVFVAVGRIGLRREPPRVAGEQSTYDALAVRLSAIAKNPTTWTIGFVVLAVGLGFAGVAAFGGLGIPEEFLGVFLGVVAAGIGLLIGGFVFFGTYYAIRSRGLGNAQGIAAGSIALGMIFVLVIALQLVFRLI